MAKIYKTEKLQGDSFYQYWVVVYRDAEGKRRTKNFKYESEAKKFARKISIDIDPPERMSAETFGAVAEDFAADCLKGRLGRSPLEPTTVQNYRRYLRQYVYEHVGKHRIQAIDYDAGMALREKILDSAPSRITAQNAFKVFKSVMNYAMEKRLIKTNPVSALNVKTDGRERKRGTITFSPDEVGKLIEFAEKLRVSGDQVTSARWRVFSPFIQVAAFCGLRASEIRGLTLDSVNFTRRTISVLGKVDRHGELSRAKSKSAYRTVPVPNETLELIRDLLADNNSKWIFSSESGGPLDHQNFLKRAWKPLKQLAGVRDIEFHSLRHFYASCLISKAATLKELQMMMGHSDPAFTLRVYGHLFEVDDEKRHAMVDEITKLVGFDSNRFSNWRRTQII